MSTRAVVKFCHGKQVHAIIYRHCDGYPEGLGEDLKAFFSYVRDNVPDTRFGDASYLAAKWVVYDSQEWGEPTTLRFLGVGVVMREPSDIEYRYIVDCDNRNKETGFPSIKCEKVYHSEIHAG
jgi:hypothetical protein